MSCHALHSARTVQLWSKPLALFPCGTHLTVEPKVCPTYKSVVPGGAVVFAHRCRHRPPIPVGNAQKSQESLGTCVVPEDSVQPFVLCLIFSFFASLNLKHRDTIESPEIGQRSPVLRSVSLKTIRCFCPTKQTNEVFKEIVKFESRLVL